MTHHLQAIATLLSLVNPVVCALIFGSIVAGQSRAEILRSATGAMLTVAFVLLVAAVAGAPLLKVFGISLDAFSVAGGGVLVVIGASMLQGSPSPSGPPAASRPNTGKLVLFAASPGTITGVITLTAAHKDPGLPIPSIVAICVVVALTWGVLVATSFKPKTGEPGLARDMASRYMGLIIVAMGLQFALSGFKAFMAG